MPKWLPGVNCKMKYDIQLIKVSSNIQMFSKSRSSFVFSL